MWYNSLQEGMVNEKLPLAIYLEYGRTESPFGFMFGANFYSTYTLDNFLMSPNYFSLALTYQPLKKIIPTRDLHFHTIVGLNIGYSKFTEKEYPGIVDYEHKVEKQFSYGMQLGAGITYMFKNIEIGPMFLYHTGKADFIAGYFSPQTFDVGSLQINILIKYRLVFNRNKNACPAYRNFNRFEL